MSSYKPVTSLGFLFDVDGVLTLPIDPSFPRSFVDKEVLCAISNLLELGYRVAFATGRSWCWIKDNLVNPFPLNFFDQIPIFLEYGLVYWWCKDLNFVSEGIYFRKNLIPAIIANIATIVNAKDILFYPDKVWCDYPDHGSLWIEDKDAMLSIAANKNISTEEVHTIVRELSSAIKADVRIIYHHLGVDILPIGWSKSKAAYKCKELLDYENKVDLWYVFGDNTSDKEMCIPFDKVLFIDTKVGASKTTIKWIQKILNKNS